MGTTTREYWRVFMAPADQYRWSTEIMDFPRRGDIYPENLVDDIDRGVRLLPSGRCIPLKPCTLTTFKANICRKDGSKREKKWFFRQYADTAPVEFIQLDFDNHVPEGALPWEQQAIEDALQDNIQRFLDLGIPAIWTTSPGQIINGEHIQGRYAWIKLSQSITVGQLRRLCRRFKDYHLLSEVECSWDTAYRNIRLPGQRHVEVCDAKTGTILFPVINKMDETLGDFMKQWDALEAQSPEAVFGESEAWLASRKPSATPVAPTQATRHLPHIEAWSVDECLSEQNTFKAATKRKVCSKLTHAYSANPALFDVAVEHAKRDLCKIRPASSHTCSDSGSLDRTMRRWMTRYFRTYDPQKRRKGNRERDLHDKQRVAYVHTIGDHIFLRALKDLPYRFKTICLNMLQKIRRFNGRVSFTELYGDHPICTARQWHQIVNSLRIFSIIDEYDVEHHKCRQWGLAEWIRDRIQTILWAKSIGDAAGNTNQGKRCRNVDKQPLQVIPILTSVDFPMTGSFQPDMVEYKNALEKNGHLVFAA